MDNTTEITIKHPSYVYFIRPKPSKLDETMPVYLVCARDSNTAWSYILKEDKDAKKDYYIDDIFVSLSGQYYGIIWPDHY
jgi:hypothetical protein